MGSGGDSDASGTDRHEYLKPTAQKRAAQRRPSAKPASKLRLKKKPPAGVGGNDGGGGGGEEGHAPLADASRTEPAAPSSPTIAQRNAGRDRTASSERQRAEETERMSSASSCDGAAPCRSLALAARRSSPAPT